MKIARRMLIEKSNPQAMPKSMLDSKWQQGLLMVSQC
jgi:hypothetical protein